MLNYSPDSASSTTAGATYAASAWVRAPAGRTVRLRVRELRGSTVVRTKVFTATGAGSWQRLALTTAATAGGTSLSVEIVVSLQRNASAHVDDVSLRRTY